jgi:hypothetical protein
MAYPFISPKTELTIKLGRSNLIVGPRLMSYKKAYHGELSVPSAAITRCVAKRLPRAQR